MLSRIAYSILVFTLSMVLLFIVKPKIAFDSNGSLRKFGVNESGSTIYSVGVLTACISIIIFYSFCVIDLVLD